MNFYPNISPPNILHTEKFVIRPLTPDHVALDYAALMRNKALLRVWSGSSWPTADFSLTDNLADLQWHWEEHQEGIAFTYTVLNPSEDACFGFIYIKPITEILAENPDWQTAALPAEQLNSYHNALVRFWTIQTAPQQTLDKSLLTVLRYWFTTNWAFSEIFWHTPVANQQQTAVFEENGLQKLGIFVMKNRGGQHFLYK
jgi:RimJ/RimL family protein N-acetyltransferase